MVLTRRAAKKQLEEEEKKKRILTGCQDAKTAAHDAENVQPPKQKKVIKAKTVDSKRGSLAPNGNQLTIGTMEKDQNQGSPARTSPLPFVAASHPVCPTLKKTSPLNYESEVPVVGSWEDIALPEESTEEGNLAVVNNQVLPEVALQSTTATTSPAPAFIAALTTKNAGDNKDFRTISNPVHYVESIKSEEIELKSEDKKTTDTSFPTVTMVAAKASSPKQESNITEGVDSTFETTEPEREQNSGKMTKKQKQKPSKEKSFTALHNTRKDHGLSTKFKAPAPHHQDTIHPAPAALVEAVQMSADSLQAQLDALTLGSPSNSTSSGSFNRQPCSSATSIDLPYFQRNPETTASIANHLTALSSQLHRLTLCVGTLQKEIAAAATPQIPDAVDRHFWALDTCALMHRSPTVDALIDVLIKQNSSASKFISVLVPLEIVRELDGLKESRDEKRRSSARKAISLLSDLQRANNGVNRGCSNETFLLYRGQRHNELLGPQGRRGDDGILDCMMLFKNAGAAEINLVTQDHNFALRAQTEGFPAMTVAQALDFANDLGGSNRSATCSYLQAAVSARSTAIPANLVPLPLSLPSQKKEQEITMPSTLHLKKEKENVVPPPPQPPIVFHPMIAPKQKNQAEQMKTPNTKQQPPSSPTLTFTIPLIWTPQPQRPQKDEGAPEAPQTVAAAVGAAAAATPITYKKWQTVNGALVRPPGLTAKQWRNYKGRQFQKLKRKQASGVTRE
ncbi:hypothetical protein Ndes2437B_g08079 [Nannochloris sp. 'desiccata']